MSHGLIRLCDVVDASIQTLCRVIIYITTLLLFLILATNVFNSFFLPSCYFRNRLYRYF